MTAPTTPLRTTPAHFPAQAARTACPWGWYELVSEAAGDDNSAAAGHKVKRICVFPGQRISLQKHAQRAEHWLVVRGTARVTLGFANETGSSALSEFDLQIGQHCDIAVGQIHRLSNLGAQPVEIIEVQMGVYLGEDDITRLEDDFGRV